MIVGVTCCQKKIPQSTPRRGQVRRASRPPCGWRTPRSASRACAARSARALWTLDIAPPAARPSERPRGAAHAVHALIPDLMHRVVTLTYCPRMVVLPPCADGFNLRTPRDARALKCAASQQQRQRQHQQQQRQRRQHRQHNHHQQQRRRRGKYGEVSANGGRSTTRSASHCGGTEVFQDRFSMPRQAHASRPQKTLTPRLLARRVAILAE